MAEATESMIGGEAAAKAGPNLGAAEGEAADAVAKPTVAHMLGELTWVLSQSPAHKHFSISDLEWMVMPAIMLEQFRVFRKGTQPLGFALWAYLSEDVEKKFKEQVESGKGARLRPDEWKSGDRLWLVELVSPFATPENKLNEAMIADLVQNVFGENNKFKFHAINPETGRSEEQGGV